MARKWHLLYSAVGSILTIFRKKSPDSSEGSDKDYMGGEVVNCSVGFIIFRERSLMNRRQVGWGYFFRRQSYYRLLLAFMLSLFLSISTLPGISQEPTINQLTAPHQGNARQLVQQGQAYYEAGQFSQAVAALEIAARLFESQADWQPLAATLTNLGRAQYGAGQPEAALRSWQDAADLYGQRLHDNAGVARSQIYQAYALQELGLYPQACATLTGTLKIDPRFCTSRTVSEQSLESMPVKLPQPDAIEIVGWRAFGDILRVIGRLKESEKVLENLARQLPPSPAKDTTRLSLGNTWKALGKREQERRLPQKFDSLPWRCEVNQTLPLPAREPYQLAEQQYQQLATATSPVTRTKAQLNRLRLATEIGDVSTAEAILSSEINLANLPPGRARVYARIQRAQSQACLRQQEKQTPSWESLTQQLNAAIQEAQQSGDDQAESYALGNLGGLYEYRAGWLEQQQQFKRAQAWRQEAVKLTEQALYLAQPSQSAHLAYQWQWQQGRLLKAQGKEREAIAAYKAAINTLESVRGDLLAINIDFHGNNYP